MDKPSLHICNHPLTQNKLAHLRAKRTNSPRFSELVRELTWLLLPKAMEELSLKTVEIETPLANAQCSIVDTRVGFFPIIRAGIPMGEAGQQLLHSAKVYHFGFRRDEETQVAAACSTNRPKSEDGIERCFVLDVMLATGGSAVLAVNFLKSWEFRKITYVAILASEQGIRTLHARHPDVPVFLAGLDPKLNDKGYIIPGLGDAGDRIYGT